MAENRPLYETEIDRRNEREVMDTVAKHWIVDYHKLPISYGLDYAITSNGTLAGYCEVKCRNHNYGTFPTYLISILKIAKATQLSLGGLHPARLIVRWQDKIGYTRIDLPPFYTYEIGGRTDRNDPADREPVALIPIDRFEILNL